MLRINKHFSNTFKAFLALIILSFFLFPVVWTFSCAFKNRADIFSYPPAFIFSPTITNFIMLLEPQRRFLQSLLNSLITAAGTTIIAVFTGALVAYAISRFRFRGRNLISMQAILLTTIPGIVLIVPLFPILLSIGLVDNVLGIILADCSWTTPFAIWVLRGFFEELPREVEEAAMIDGCTRFNTFLRITLPLALPGIIASGIIIFLAVWNEFMFANILSRVHAKTLTVLMAGFVTPVETVWELIFASQVLAELPVILLTVAVYKHMVRGLTFGAVKG